MKQRNTKDLGVLVYPPRDKQGNRLDDEGEVLNYWYCLDNPKCEAKGKEVAKYGIAPIIES